MRCLTRSRGHYTAVPLALCNCARSFCSRCSRAGDECTFNMRVWHQPHAQQQQNEECQQRGLDRPQSYRVQPAQVLQHLTSGAVLGYGGLLPFKRYPSACPPVSLNNYVGVGRQSTLYPMASDRRAERRGGYSALTADLPTPIHLPAATGAG